MIAVMLVPVALILAVCLLERLERYLLKGPPAARSPIPRPVPAAGGPVAEVVSLHGTPARDGPTLDGATLRLRRAS